MKLRKVLLLILFLFPVVVHGVETETLDTPVSLGYPSGPIKDTWYRTSPMYYYSINGNTAYCMDQQTPNPNLLRQRTIYIAGKDNFGDGLIAMMNFNKLEMNYEAGLYEAIRIFTTEKKPNGNPRQVNSSGLGELSGHVKKTLQILQVGNDAYNGDTKYLPITSGASDMEDDFSLEVIDDNNLNNIKVRINFDSSKPSNFKMSSKCTTSNSNYSCSIVSALNSNNEFSFSLKGKSNAGGNIVVKFNFGNSSAGGEMYDRVYVYGCSDGEVACRASHAESTGGYQRFLTVDNNDLIDGGTGSGSGGITKEVRITVPGICDDPNLSQDELLENGCCDKIKGEDLEDNSKAQDTYIKYCGPIVHTENDCGNSDSCGENSYTAFSHSYVRLRNMYYMIEDFKKNNDLNEFADYLDTDVNSYCGIYTTEKLDIFTPGTAASVSGQFFVFDSYNKTDINNINAYFRQPYVVERVKSTFLFNYNGWKSNYNTAVTNEKNAYDEWQSAVKAVGSAYKAYTRVKDYDPYQADICKGNLRTSEDCYNYVESVKQQKVDTEANYTNAISTEKEMRNSYRSKVAARTSLQGMRNYCINRLNSFSSDYKFDFDNNKPSVDFTYSQTSQKEGKTTITINMVDNTSPVKYWPNTTTNSSNGNYLGNGYVANGTEKVDFSRTGVMLADEFGNTTSYSFPNASIDGCNGGENCKKYEYTGLAYSSIQGVSDATDPYGEDMAIVSPETISKIYYFRPPNNTFALMNSGEYKTLNYEANAAHSDLNGLEVGYVYNIELTTYKGSYDTSFSISNYGYKVQDGKVNLIQKLLNKFGLEDKFNLNDNNLTSTCSYCNMEMAFKRNCDVCDPNDPTTYDFEPQFYYRSISLSDVTPNEREGETNWTDAKGTAAKTQIELGSGIANSDMVKNNNEYVALANGNDYSKDGKISTYLADSSNVGKHDIYDDGTREYLEYEVTLTTKDMQMIKRNSSRSYFNYAKMNMCAGFPKNVKDADEQYCFKCNSDMKECESSFVTSFFSDTTGRSKWKYYVNGQYCVGNIKTCIKGLDYTMVDSKGQIVSDLDGIYPDPLFPKQFLERYKNWP